MAFARDSYTATAAQTDFVINFAYLNTSHVEVQLNGVVQTITTDYTIVGGGATVRFNSGLTAGDIVVLTRKTSQNTRLVDYVVPGTLTEADLDTDSLQAFYISQEAFDRADLSLGVNDATDQWDADSKKIENLADGTSATDAVTKSQLDAAVILSGNVPTPDNPGDDGAYLRASGGTFDWATGAQPLPVAYGGTGAITALAALNALAALGNGVTTVTDADRTMVAGDRGQLIRFDPGASDRDYNLLAAATAGAGYVVAVSKINDDAGAVIIDPSGSETVDGFTTFHLVHEGDTVVLMSDGSNWEVLSKSLSPVFTAFTSSGTYTPTPGRRRAFVRLVGAGGGGGAVNAGTGVAEAAGGAGGGYAEETYSISDLGASVAVTIGAGGAGGVSSTSNGAAGGTTSFGAFMSATGGDGGFNAPTTTGDQSTLAPAGGLGSGGDVNLRGGHGGAGRVSDGDAHFNGHGGASAGPWGTIVSNTSGATAGADGTDYGNGGAPAFGSGSAHNGGSGADGYLDVTET